MALRLETISGRAVTLRKEQIKILPTVIDADTIEVELTESTEDPEVYTFTHGSILDLEDVSIKFNIKDVTHKDGTVEHKVEFICGKMTDIN